MQCQPTFEAEGEHQQNAQGVISGLGDFEIGFGEPGEYPEQEKHNDDIGHAGLQMSKVSGGHCGDRR